MDKYIELAKKLKALAQSGEGGEKVNAQRQLDRLMAKYGITQSDLESEEIGSHVIYCKDEEMLSQVIAVTLGVKVKVFTYKNVKKKHVGFYCTAAKALEIEAMYEHYYRLFKEEVKVFKYAFYKANNLLVAFGSTDKQPTKEELEMAERANEMSRNIKSESLRKALPQPVKLK